MKTKETPDLSFSSDALKSCIDNKTKPLGSLGRIEELAFRIGMIQESLKPTMNSCQLTLFAGDHGIARSGVSAYPQAVTRQMVLNFLSGGAAANVFARTLDIDMRVVDSGVAGPAIEHAMLLNRSMGPGTANFLKDAAMSQEQFSSAIRAGKRLSNADQYDAVCFGEMGIGNTSSASMIAHKLLKLPLGDLVGRGTGLDDQGLDYKLAMLRQAAERTPDHLDIENILMQYGGFEIVMMVGSMLAVSSTRATIIVDGFIASAAAAAAIAFDPAIEQKMIFAHVSAESGHQHILESLGVKPLLDLGLRLGEGTGSLLAWPMLKSAAAMLCDMASFESASVSGPV